MKYLSRILIILIAATVVMGVTMAIAYTSGAAQASSSAMHRPTMEDMPSSSDTSSESENHPVRPESTDGSSSHREEKSSASFHMSSVFKNLGTIAAIIVGTLIIRKLFPLYRAAQSKTNKQNATA